MAACLAAIFAYGSSPECNDIGIRAVLTRDGGADITEVWDIAWNKTEWYLVRENLGDIEISGLSVSDATGRQFTFEDSWDVDRSLEQKAGHCGIVRKRNGCELCWGVGSPERQVFTVNYHMSNVVKSMDDFDMLHLQFISPGINPRPRHAKVTVSRQDGPLEDGPALAWSFGFNGTVGFSDGNIVAETSEAFASDAESVILLLRFDKGLFSPSSVREGSFEDVKEHAFEGSDYQAWIDGQDDGMDFKGVLSFFITLALIIFALSKTSERKRNRDMLGVVKLKEIGYERDIPFGGDILESRYVLEKCRRLAEGDKTASALVLRMIKDGWLSVENDGDRKVKLVFTDKVPDTAENCITEFYNMLKDAAGSDGILEGKEFSRWSRKNAETVNNWIGSLNKAGAARIQSDGYGKGTVFTPEGQKQARKVIGFRNFLKDFTLLDERGSREVALWQDYLIFASLYGIADKVAKELRDIDPKAFETYVGYPYATYNTVINMSDRVGRSMVAAASSLQTSSSVGGHGGFSSFGGGGGFSGGGFGGGGR